MTIPDTIEPILAVRQFALTEDASDRTLPALSSLSFKYTWVPGIQTAECFRLDITGPWTVTYQQAVLNPTDRSVEFHRGQDAPVEGCTCGFYALNNAMWIWGERSIWAVVELSGKVIVGDRGYRAQKAKVVGLLNTPVLPDIAFAQLAQRYDAERMDHLPTLTDPKTLYKEEPWTSEKNAPPSSSSPSPSLQVFPVGRTTIHYPSVWYLWNQSLSQWVWYSASPPPDDEGEEE
jgi:hypothetical protein